MSGALLRALPTPDVAAADVRRTVEEVLRQERFAGAEPSWAQRALAWVGDQVASLLGLLTSGAPGRVAVATVFAVAVVALLAVGAWSLRRVRRSGGSPRSAGTAPHGRTAEQWRTAAERAAADGDLREAVRCRYRALVADFAAAGWLEEIPGRTAGQYLAAVRADVPTAAGAFGHATDLFERVWYGHAPAQPRDVDEITRLARQAVDRAGHAARGAHRRIAA